MNVGKTECPVDVRKLIASVLRKLLGAPEICDLLPDAAEEASRSRTSFVEVYQACCSGPGGRLGIREFEPFGPTGLGLWVRALEKGQHVLDRARGGTNELPSNSTVTRLASSTEIVFSPVV